MTSFAVERHIAAPPDRVWRLLIDPRRLADGNFGIIRIDGDIADGGRFRLWSEIDPKRAFALRVSVFNPFTAMEWTRRMPFGLFSGRRRFTLAPEGEGTRFTMREDYSGPLAGLITRAIPDLNGSFEKFAAGLEKAAREEQT